MVTNSHMDLVYPNPVYATGGSIGDVLFFFISGFALNYTARLSLVEWFKKRLKRIYLIIFSATLFLEILQLQSMSVVRMVFEGGGWFIQCLLLYYLLFFLVRDTDNKKLFALIFIIFGLSCIYICINQTRLNPYGDTYFRWLHYSISFFSGIIVFRFSERLEKFKYPFLSSFSAIVLYYCLLYVADFDARVWKLAMILSIPTLSLVPIFLYIFFERNAIYFGARKTLLRMANFIGLMALEIYLVQAPLIGPIYVDNIFLNICLTWTLIFIVAYLCSLFVKFITH